MKKRFSWPVTPLAKAENTVTFHSWRFTLLTERLIRLEFDPNGVFEDRASQSAFHRDFPAVTYTEERTDEALTLDTACLQLTCGQSLESLTITLKIPPATTWHYGEPFETLGGTVCTLDGVDGAIPVDDGVCSRSGFAVLDDSNRMVLNVGWVDVRAEGTKDLYFFGYGHDYRAAVADYYRLTGIPPLLPAYALGNWWSRYHTYTQQEYLELMENFKREDIPFSVAVIDMDWHYVYIPDRETGWTGYTWNTDLFPDYKQFLKDLHTYDVKTALNLHPADGIRKHEAMYADMCKALGRPVDGEPCKLDILDPNYMEKYFDVVHHPYEQDGVDFWWMDWQQGTDYHWIHEPNKDGKLQDRREVLDPLWQLNHLHIMDIQRDGKRPMFFSRYSGPGSQRYPVGFSGDTSISWESLAFQPEFTATSSNIGYAWWSHDIGGHNFGYRDDELTARWLQFGLFSPINRLHSAYNPFINKEPWDYNTDTERVMRACLKLRHQLFPYLYTMNYRTHTELLPLVQPMYYSHPECQNAYNVPTQYWFGDQFFVAPITQKGGAGSTLGKVKTWIPSGVWTDFFTGAVYDGLGGRMLDLYRNIDSIPVLCKAGAIVPLRTHIPHDNRLCGAEALDVLVFPGGDNTFTLYEDAGDGTAYQEGAFATTAMHLAYTDTKTTFRIAPSEGDRSLIPATRQYTVKFRGFAAPDHVAVNGKETDFAFDAKTHTSTGSVEATTVAGVTVELCGNDLRNRNDDFFDKAVDILKRSQCGMPFKETLYNHLITLPRDIDVFKMLFDLWFIAPPAEPNEREVLFAMLEQYQYDREYRRP